MTSLLRVPFGLRQSDNVWVGPEDVDKSGLACGCICPYCKLPLKKNACKDRVDHFSHHTRQQQDKVRHECEYSFWVACATMARQLLEKGGDLLTPQYSKPLDMPASSWLLLRHDMPKVIDIAPASAITFTAQDIAIGEIVDQRLTDAVISVHGVRVMVFFIHPERADVNTDDISRDKTGALVIDLEELRSIYKTLRGAESFKEKIRICLFETVTNKEWLWHPREARLMAAAEEELHKASHEINHTHSHSQPQHQQQQYIRPAYISGRPAQPRQGPQLTSRWRNLICICGHRFREFVHDNVLENICCQSCGKSGHQNLRILP